MQLPVVSVVTQMTVELVCRAAQRLLESLCARRRRRARRPAVRVSGAGRVGAVVLVLVVTDDTARQWGAGR